MYRTWILNVKRWKHINVEENRAPWGKKVLSTVLHRLNGKGILHIVQRTVFLQAFMEKEVQIRQIILDDLKLRDFPLCQNNENY